MLGRAEQNSMRHIFTANPFLFPPDLSDRDENLGFPLYRLRVSEAAFCGHRLCALMLTAPVGAEEARSQVPMVKVSH